MYTFRQACRSVLVTAYVLVALIFSLAFDADPKGVGEEDSILKSSVVLSVPVTGEVLRSCTIGITVVVVVVVGVAILAQVQTQLTSSFLMPRPPARAAYWSLSMGFCELPRRRVRACCFVQFSVHAL